MPGDDTREQVLATIRTATTDPTVDEIAAALDLHPNSVRGHTAALRDAGLITQDSRASSGGGRGRPQVTYRTSTQGAWTGPRDYRLLASLLMSALDGTDSERAATARRTGEAWGRRIAAGQTPGTPEPAAREHVVATLDDLGFEPTPAGTGDEVELRNCPFLELVDDSRDAVVCALHAGMLDGLVKEDETVVDLLPFTTPRACTVRMRAAPS